MQALAQEIKVLDELESPIKEAHIVSLDQKKHAFTNKFGLVDLSAFDSTERFEISHPSFIPIVTTKRKLKQNNNSVILLFNTETLGEIVLLTRIEDENLKTTADIEKFQWSASKYNYDSQAYIYSKLFGYEFLFIVIDKNTHQIGMFDCSPQFYERGEEKVRKASEAYDLFYKTRGFDPKQYFISKTL